MTLFQIAKRNIKIFFRDKTQVFFSLLSVIIIIGLYILFLGDMLTQSFEIGEGTRFMMDSWIMAGLIAVSSVTTVMGAFGSIVDDKTLKIIKDFKSAPVSRIQIVLGYILSSFIIGLILCLITLVLAEIYIVVYGGQLLSLAALGKTLLVMLLSLLSSCAMIYCLVSLFESNSAYGTASTVIGTMIGFLTGIYIPLGALPEAVQAFIKAFPPSHAAALLRQIMMDVPMKGAPAEDVFIIKEKLGVEFQMFGQTASPLVSVLILVAAAVLFFGLAVLMMKRKKK